MSDKLPIIDLHCDMLTYLAHSNQHSIDDKEEIGCALPHLINGGVKLQVTALYSSTNENSVENGFRQIKSLRRLLVDNREKFLPINNLSVAINVLNCDKQNIGVIGAIENCSVFCTENESMAEGFRRLDQYRRLGRILYLSLTHHGENRFGGGNKTNNGLKRDGKRLLEYLDNLEIAVDLSHACDQLAVDIINYIDNKDLTIPIIVSHSNFRKILDSKRNLPDEIAKEIIHRNGLIGINFLKKYIHPNQPQKLFEHIEYGLKLGGESAICFGADFFPTGFVTDRDKHPFFFKQHKNASAYPDIIYGLRSYLRIQEKQVESICYDNVINFLKRNWSD